MTEEPDYLDAVVAAQAPAGFSATPGIPAAVANPAVSMGPLHLRNYRIFLAAISVDYAGQWVHLTVLGWLALQLTNSAFFVSLANVAWFVPFLLLALPAGILADRADRRIFLMTIHFMQSAILMAMSALAGGGQLSYPVLLLLTGCVSSVIALDLPMRQSLVVNLVKPSQIVSATALSQASGSFMRIVGPLLAGFLLAHFGAATGFAFYGVVELLFASSFLVIKRSEAPGGGWKPANPTGRNPLHETADGFRYIAANPDIRGLVLISIGAGVIGWVYLALMPVMARDVLHGDSFLLGILGSAVGLGGFLVGLLIAFRQNIPRPAAVMVAGFVAWGVGVILFALSPIPVLSFVPLVMAGAGFSAQMAFTQALILRTTDPGFHGRVFGVLSFTWGANIVGTLTAGSLAKMLGAPAVIGGSGALILVVTLVVVATHPRLLRMR